MTALSNPPAQSVATGEWLHMSAGEIAAALRAGELSARDVVEAHIARLEAFHPRTRAIAVPRFDAARAEADDADRRLTAEAPDELPPLLGVPCTVKESFAFSGLPNTAGLLSRRGQVAERDAPTVARLRAAGAIPLGLTNISELCMWIEADNPVYGRSASAYDARRTAGGSSGGEGAAVGSGGSPFGLGSDIAGSVRIPAFFNGVFAHKPSRGVVPNTGQFPLAQGDALRMLSPGPLTRRAEDLMPLLRVLAGPDGEDEHCVATELRDPDEVDFEGLEVVIVEGDGLVPVSRRVSGGLQRAAGALQALGACVRTERIAGLRQAFILWASEMTAAGSAQFAGLLGADTGKPVRVGRALADAVRRRSPHTKASLMLLAVERIGDLAPSSASRSLRAAGQRLAEEMAELIGDGVLLYPPHPWVAPRHGWPLAVPVAFAYTAIFNVAGTPVTEIPVGLDERGLPLGVQVAAARGADHRTIAVAGALERALGGWKPPEPPGS